MTLLTAFSCANR